VDLRVTESQAQGNNPKHLILVKYRWRKEKKKFVRISSYNIQAVNCGFLSEAEKNIFDGAMGLMLLRGIQ